MSMHSSLINRRIPQQQRGERRVTQLLEAAATALAEAGYDGATMTAIAERAGASIGAVYQYFPNKEAIVLALRKQYGDEMEASWTSVVEFTEGMSVHQIAHRFVDLMVDFLEEHPAYFPVVDAPVQYVRDQDARNRLRQRLASVFLRRKPTLSPEEGFRMANVVLQIIKSMNALYRDAHAQPDERQALIDEYKQVLTSYLQSRLSA